VFADIGMDLPTHLLAGLRLAPRQIALMGHATTTGMPTLSHYFSGDHEGPDGDRHYRERLVRLPRLGAAQHAPHAPPPRAWRVDLGIPEDAVVFVNLNNGLKLLPERDGVYMDILRRLPGAFLVLKPFFEPASVDARLPRRLVAAAEARGVADRLRIVPPLRRAADVAGLLAAADVHLDSYPFGGWTTNLDALAAGLPMVTQEGETGRSRWGAAFLRHMGVAEGIAADAEEYVDWAVRIGGDAALRGRVRARVRERAGMFFDGPAAQPAYEEALRAVLAAST
jgi:predicted O-linked N-acetylglucosamine transferase (SPINDLY family)